MSHFFEKLCAVSQKLILVIKFISLYWAYIWPPLFAIGVISSKYLGNDNIIEQTIEAINKLETGANVDISKESLESSEPNNLKKYIPNER